MERKHRSFLYNLLDLWRFARGWDASRLAAGLALVALALALPFPWVGVPLFGSVNSFALPVDVGWGVRLGVVSYGSLTLIVTLVFGWRLAATRRWRSHARQWQAQPMRARTLMKLGAIAGALPLLFIFQFILVDLGLVAHLADQENQSLLIRQNLGYTVSLQRLSFTVFQIPNATVSDRGVLLFQLAKPGLVMPFVAMLLCFVGVGILRHKAPRNSPTLGARLPSGHRTGVWLAAGIVGIILLGRAPLGLFVDMLGKQALSEGDYHAALQRFTLAEALAPALGGQLAFHQARGAALLYQGQTNQRDAVLYQAAQYRALGALTRARDADQTLLTTYPHDALVTLESALTLETQVETDLNTALNFNDAQRIGDFPLDPLHGVEQVLPTLEEDLPQLDNLLVAQPDNLYAHFLRGRILLITRSYDRAALDFRASLALTADRDMRSASDTYLAFCLGGQGDFAGERRLLLTAMELDDGYYNTTAREAASGLH